jgi:hypothetical protein
MKKITFNKPEDQNQDRRFQDSLEIVDALHNLGYNIDYEDAELAWGAHSRSTGQNWADIPEDDKELLASVLKHCSEQGGPDNE